MTTLDLSNVVDVAYLSRELPPCDYRAPCTAPAVWAGVQMCSHRHQVQFCNEHKAAGEKRLRDCVTVRNIPTCRDCGEHLSDPFVKWRPM